MAYADRIANAIPRKSVSESEVPIALLEIMRETLVHSIDGAGDVMTAIDDILSDGDGVKCSGVCTCPSHPPRQELVGSYRHDAHLPKGE